MAVTTIPEKIKAAMDLTVTLAVQEVAEDLHKDEAEVLADFMQSKTGTMVYTDETKLWWAGPSAIADLYKKEIHV